MSYIKICRVCLCRGVKMYKYDEFSLKQYYEELNAAFMNEEDNLPPYFCYTCAALLYKFHKFKQKCSTGQRILNKVLQNESITTAKLHQIDKASKNLQTTINILTVNNRVKTFTINDHFLEINEAEPSSEFYDDDWSITDSIHLSDTEEKSKDILNNEDKTKNETNVPVKEDNRNDNLNLDLDTWSLDSEDKSNNSIKDCTIQIEKNDIVMQHFGQFLLRKENESDSNNRKNKRKYPRRKPKIDAQELNKIKAKRKNNESNKVPKRKPNGTAKKRNTRTASEKERSALMYGCKSELNSEHWEKTVFTEDVARERFREKASNPKYLSAKFACDKCFRVFTKEDMLVRHMKLRHCETIGPFECDFCKMRFKYKALLAKHTSEHYDLYKCLRCDYTGIYESSVKNHDVFHNGFKKECKLCQQEFRHPSTYYTHVRVHHRSEHVCTLCGASFVSKVGLIQHKTIRHVVDNQEPETEDKNTYCERCDIKFKTQKAYLDHFRESIKHAEDLPVINTEGSSIEITPLKEASKDMTKHCRPSRLTECTVCSRKFSTYVAYKAHHLAEHPMEPLALRKGASKESASTICDICGAMVKTCYIAIHYNTHTREKLYPCPICGMQFTNIGNMHTHQVTHTGEKPHKCPLCEKCFTQKVSMKLHYRTFHLKEPYPKKKKKIPITSSDNIF
ncbi:uncharacterized protein LOC142982621 [Anticarsia gemmatalis]|uniref:uncharacterized protein LOC142982621 n=1 Tax=Anticarsia gemmatalis TaxID=129554 RepID=UPI003F770054